MPATYANKPTSEWDHSHALQEGDELVDDDGDVGTVVSVHDDGSVTVAWGGGEMKHGEGSITRSLADGVVKTEDGQSHELATY